MNQTFHTYIQQYQVVRPERLYGDFRRYTETSFTTDHASIYFVVKCKPVEWLPGSFSVGDDFKLEGRIRVDGSEHTVQLDMAEFWFAAPDMQTHFKTQEEMRDYFMARCKTVPGNTASSAKKYQRCTTIEIDASGPEKLVIECELRRNMTKDGIARTEIYPYQAINFFELPGPKLDIVYIGSSASSTFDRLYKHEKWGRIHAEKQRDEDILVYFAQLHGDKVGRISIPGIHQFAKMGHDVPSKDETLITEMALINYFKPHYNTQHKESDIIDSVPVERSLKSQGFDEIVVELDLDGPMGVLGSPHVGFYGAHTTIHEIV